MSALFVFTGKFTFNSFRKAACIVLVVLHITRPHISFNNMQNIKILQNLLIHLHPVDNT